MSESEGFCIWKCCTRGNLTSKVANTIRMLPRNTSSVQGVQCNKNNHHTINFLKLSCWNHVHEIYLFVFVSLWLVSSRSCCCCYKRVFSQKHQEWNKIKSSRFFSMRIIFIMLIFFKRLQLPSISGGYFGIFPLHYLILNLCKYPAHDNPCIKTKTFNCFQSTQ